MLRDGGIFIIYGDVDREIVFFEVKDDNVGFNLIGFSLLML